MVAAPPPPKPRGPGSGAARRPRSRGGGGGLHPLSITRFPLIIFSPGAGLLRNPSLHR